MACLDSSNRTSSSIGTVLTNRRFRRQLRVCALLAISAVPLAAYTYDLPGGPFSAGTTISATAVNAKFAALLEAVNELQASSVSSGADADLSDVTARTVTVTEPTTRTLTYWADRAFVCEDNNCDGTASDCWAQINGRPGCIVNNMTARTRVTIPIDHIPDGTITEWGMHIGTSISSGANNWSCELRYVNNTVSTIDFTVNAASQWNRFVNAIHVDAEVDNYGSGAVLGAGFFQGWHVRCISDGSGGRLDFHQIYVRTRQESL